MGRCCRIAGTCPWSISGLLPAFYAGWRYLRSHSHRCVTWYNSKGPGKRRCEVGLIGLRFTSRLAFRWSHDAGVPRIFLSCPDSAGACICNPDWRKSSCFLSYNCRWDCSSTWSLSPTRFWAHASWNYRTSPWDQVVVKLGYEGFRIVLDVFPEVDQIAIDIVIDLSIAALLGKLLVFLVSRLP